MAFRVTHELHGRRFGRNLGVAVLLAGFVALVFALTIVKIEHGDQMQGYDHTVRPEMIPAGEEGSTAPAAMPEAGQ